MRLRRSLAVLLAREHFSREQPKMAFVVGPRQCGKTTMARMLQEERDSKDLYRNWDDLAWRAEIARRPYGFLDAYRSAPPGRPLAVLDEVHKFPRWKKYLKGLWDTRSHQADILVTGSGRLDVYRRGGDSLLGRYHQYRLHPFSVSEVLGKTFAPDPDTPGNILKAVLGSHRAVQAPEREAFEGLLRFGGFPEPFLAQSERGHRLWIRERRERLVREDLRDMTRIQLLSSVEQMIELLIPRVGALLSLNNLRQDLGTAPDSVRLWMDMVERLYYGFRIRPFGGRIARALVKAPKFYLHDWSEIPEEGRRLENMVAAGLLRWCHFTEDWGQEKLELRFVRDKEGRKADFLLTLAGRPLLLIEVKLAETVPGDPLRRFAAALNCPGVLLVGRLERPGSASGVTVLPAASFLAALP